MYEPQRFEPRWAKWWVDEQIFRVTVEPKDLEPGHEYFSLAIPPPNVTGSLHMGHMFEHSIIDAQIRWRRMTGLKTLWVPGTDHAGIATQIMVERQLAEEGLNKRDLGREAFEARVWHWKEQYGGRIVEQMKRAGVSCDWSREHFTLDPDLSRAVREAFVRLYEKGLIYRANYIVNWCPRCQTALSDLEVMHEETQGHLWHIVYPVKDSSLKLVVATTRPETMLGDTGVAINPNDPRAEALHLKSVHLPLTDRNIPIVLDEMAELGFGTGAVKITPAHDPNDFEAGRRHDLPSIKVIDENAKMTAAAGKFAGLDRFEARKQRGGGSGAAGPAGEDRALHAERRQMRSLQDHGRAAGLHAVVREDQASGRKGHRGGGNRPHPVRPGQLDQDLLRVDVQHPRLVHLAPALVGPSHSRVALPECATRSWWRARRPPSARAAGRRSSSRIPTCSIPGSAPALWPFSTLGWPDETDGSAALLSHLAADHRLRHPVLLGGPHDHDGHRVHGRGALPPGLHSRPGARRRAAEDVEDQAATPSTRW